MLNCSTLSCANILLHHIAWFRALLTRTCVTARFHCVGQQPRKESRDYKETMLEMLEKTIVF